MPGQPIPTEPQDAAVPWLPQQLLHKAQREVSRFRACLILTIKSKEDRSNPIFRHWADVGAHGAIASMFHFHDVLLALLKLGEPDHPKNLMIGAVAQDTIDMLFRLYPKLIQTRHASAHSAAVATNFEKNAFRGRKTSGSFQKLGNGPVLFSDCWEDLTFLTTRKGEILRFDMTWENYLRFESVYDFLRQGGRLGTSPQP